MPTVSSPKLLGRFQSSRRDANRVGEKGERGFASNGNAHRRLASIAEDHLAQVTGGRLPPEDAEARASEAQRRKTLQKVEYWQKQYRGYDDRCKKGDSDACTYARNLLNGYPWALPPDR